MKQLLNDFINKLDLNEMLKSSYFNEHSETFFTIKFTSLPETDKMIKALIKSQPDDCNVEHVTDSGTRIRLQLVHEPKGRPFTNKATKALDVALKSANTILINIKHPTTIDDIANKLPSNL